MSTGSSCADCGRKVPSPHIKASRRWLSERGYCVCAAPHDSILKDPAEKFDVYTMLSWLPNGVHDYCGNPRCEVCKR